MSADPRDLLFTDLQGEDANLEDVLASGLDGDLSERVPALIGLLDRGEPDHQLYAAVLLLGWGRAEGFEALSRWAAAPDDVPWRSAPVSRDRFSGEDDSFGLLAFALATSGWLDRGPELVAMQVRAYRELLSLYDRVAFGRWLADALDGRRDIGAVVVPEVVAAIERGLDRLAAPDRPGLRFQLAALLVALAPHDGASTVRLAGPLLEGADGRTEREVAFALKLVGSR